MLTVSSQAADYYSQTVICGDTEAVFNVIQQEYDEEPMMMGEAEMLTSEKKTFTGTMLMWVNSKRQTYTITVSGKTSGRTCVLVTGSDLIIQGRRGPSS